MKRCCTRDAHQDGVYFNEDLVSRLMPERCWKLGKVSRQRVSDEDLVLRLMPESCVLYVGQAWASGDADA